VFGLEAQGNWADFQGSNVACLAAPAVNRSKIDAFGPVHGQVGYAANNVLFYVKGRCCGDRQPLRRACLPARCSIAPSRPRWGATVGAGVEYAFAPNWSVGVEYNHLFMQDRSYTFTARGGAFFSAERVRQDVDLVTARS
jgi:outer membrane immunogenic protein